MIKRFLLALLLALMASAAEAANCDKLPNLLVEGTTAFASKVMANLNMLLNCKRNLFSVVQYGADPTGVADSAAAVQLAVNAAKGQPVYFPQGTYKVCTLITTTYPMILLGDGPGIGPGLTNTASASIIKLCGATQSGFRTTSYYQSVFANFQLIGPAQTAGIGIQVIPAGTATAQPIFYNLALGSTSYTIQGLYNPIQVTRPTWPLFSHIYCQGWGAGGCISMNTSANIEGSGGWIQNGEFFGSFGDIPTQGPAIYSEVGYTHIHHSQLIGGNATIRFNIKNNPAGMIKIDDNTIENFANYGVLIGSGDGSAIAMVMIQNNEFASGVSTATVTAALAIQEYLVAGVSQKYLDSVEIAGNVYRMQMSAASTKYVWVQTGKSVSVHNEHMYDYGGSSPICYQITGNIDSSGFVKPILVADNSCVGTSTPGASFTTLVTLRDTINGWLTANLPAVANGSQVFVTDADPGSSPCTHAGAQTGAMAFYQNNAWKCF